MQTCTKTMHNTSCVPGTDSWTRTSGAPYAWIAPAITMRRVVARLGTKTFCLDKVFSSTAPKYQESKTPFAGLQALNLTKVREHHGFGAPMHCNGVENKMNGHLKEKHFIVTQALDTTKNGIQKVLRLTFKLKSYIWDMTILPWIRMVQHILIVLDTFKVRYHFGIKMSLSIEFGLS